MIKKFYLNIAGFVFQIVFEDVDLAIYKQKWIANFEENYNDFFIHRKFIDIDHVIRFTDYKSYPIYKNKNEKLMVFVRDDSLKVSTTSYAIGIIQFEAIIMSILETKLAEQGGFFLHASAVCITGKAILATGQSGSGKSTFAQVVENTHQILADDFVILVKKGKTYVMYPTPRYEKIPIVRGILPIPLMAVFFLKKTKKTTLIKVSDKQEIIRSMEGQLLIMEEKVRKQLFVNYLNFINSFNHFYLFSFSKYEKSIKSLIKKQLPN